VKLGVLSVKMRTIVIMVLVIFVLLGAFYLGMYYSSVKYSREIALLVTQLDTKAANLVRCAPSPKDQTSTRKVEETLQTYTSKKLGLSFSYLQPKESQGQWVTEEANDTISIYYQHQSGIKTSSKFVQVFYKDAQQSLEAAIKEQLMQNFSAEDCTITTPSMSYNHAIYSPNNEYLVIRVVNQNENHEEFVKQLEKCPNTYTFSWKDNGYFVTDKMHQDRFAYVSLGQDSIFAYPDVSWDMTIRFLD